MTVPMKKGKNVIVINVMYLYSDFVFLEQNVVIKINSRKEYEN